MSRRFALLWAPLLLCWAGPTTHAQSSGSAGAIPTRTALSRVGLERQWLTVAPVAGSEQILRISRSEDLLFVQTNQGMLHVYQAESGRPLWSATIGELSPKALPVAQNSYAVFAACGNKMMGLDRNTGRELWRVDLGTLPSTGLSADEENLVIGLESGMLQCYSLKEKQEKGPDAVRGTPALVWRIASGGAIRTRPMLGEGIVCMGSSDGRVYVNLTSEATALYRILTGGPIGRDLAYHGTRMLLIPSADDALYAVDVLTSKIIWTFPSGAPIEQGPIVAQDEIFVVNEVGGLSTVDPKTGSPRWTLNTDRGTLMGVSPSKVYILSQDNDLMIASRESGKLLLDPAATFQRAGLNLRDFTITFAGRFDDRMYLATPSGVLLCIREIGLTTPQRLRAPSENRFGHVPPEGIKDLPNPFEEAPAPNPDAPVENENQPEATDQF